MKGERERKEGRSRRRRDACEPAAVVGAATFRLTSKFTFVDVGLDDLYVLLGAPVAHLLLFIKLNIHAHNSTSPRRISSATRSRYYRALLTFMGSRVLEKSRRARENLYARVQRAGRKPLHQCNVLKGMLLTDMCLVPYYCSQCALCRIPVIQSYIDEDTFQSYTDRTVVDACYAHYASLRRLHCTHTRYTTFVGKRNRDFLSFRVFCCFVRKRSRPRLRADLNVAHVASSFSYSLPLLSFLFLSSPLFPLFFSLPLSYPLIHLSPYPLLASLRLSYHILMYLTVATLPHIRYRVAAWWGRMRIFKEWEVVHRYFIIVWWGFIW